MLEIYHVCYEDILTDILGIRLTIRGTNPLGSPWALAARPHWAFSAVVKPILKHPRGPNGPMRSHETNNLGLSKSSHTITSIISSKKPPLGMDMDGLSRLLPTPHPLHPHFADNAGCDALPRHAARSESFLPETKVPKSWGLCKNEVPLKYFKIKCYSNDLPTIFPPRVVPLVSFTGILSCGSAKWCESSPLFKTVKGTRGSDHRSLGPRCYTSWVHKKQRHPGGPGCCFLPSSTAGLVARSQLSPSGICPRTEVYWFSPTKVLVAFSSQYVNYVNLLSCWCFFPVFTCDHDLKIADLHLWDRLWAMEKLGRFAVLMADECRWDFTTIQHI